MTQPVVIVGAGACGMVAALALVEAGIDCVLLERDATPQGSTALSSGFIPACNTRWQHAAGVDDNVQQFAADIQRKNGAAADEVIVQAVCAQSGDTLEWLADAHDIPFQLLQGFLYPGHSVARMHAVPEKTGAGLMGRLTRAVQARDVPLITHAKVTSLHADAHGRIEAVTYAQPNGAQERIDCSAVVLACNGFGGNREMVQRYIPEIAQAPYAGHTGNQGDAVRWGQAMGAQLADMGAYQGHGSWAMPHGALVTWALMMEGGVQINAQGARFHNEHDGYSEAAPQVVAQPGGVAWNVFDQRLHQLGLTFPDYAALHAAGGVIGPIGGAANDPDEARRAALLLAQRLSMPEEALFMSLSSAQAGAKQAWTHGGCNPPLRDAFAREFHTKPPLAPPYYAVKVTGALFHTQGGLGVDAHARVLREAGSAASAVFPNLYAGGGAARGISGAAVWGYLSGNGLLTAVTLGHRAAQHIVAARG
jgi:fumarate reductase flavoprotein subunit